MLSNQQEQKVTKNVQKMEQNLPIIARKIWKIVRVVYFMFRKGISKGKLLSALNVMMKRGKIAGREAIQNLIFHHHVAASARRPHEYEHSCGDSPAITHFPFHLDRRKSSCGRTTTRLSDKELMTAAEEDEEVFYSTATSPALSGFGPSPIVRVFEEDNHVDKAAAEFIMKFYKDLMQQDSMDSCS